MLYYIPWRLEYHTTGAARCPRSSAFCRSKCRHSGGEGVEGGGRMVSGYYYTDILTFTYLLILLSF